MFGVGPTFSLSRDTTHRPRYLYGHWSIHSSKMKPVTAKWPKKWHPRNPERPLTKHPNMSREAPLSVAERDFILKALQEDVRLDGRKADQFRPLNISFGEEYGHVKLQLGKTR